MKKPSKFQNTKKHSQADMAVLLEGAGIFLSDAQLHQLWSYHNLLRRYNPELNLTRIHNFTNMVQKLYVDSILPGQMVKLPSPLLDIGTGPGMPGIPLKIAFPDLEIILAESRQHRAEFLETVITTLNFRNISVVGHGIIPKFARPVSGVITRAVESIEKTLLRINGCLAEDGLAVFMKGPACDDEISAAGDRFNQSYTLLINQSYQIPDTPHRRRLVVFRRIDAPGWEKEKRAMSKHAARKIESEQNDTFKELKKLLTSRGIKKQEKALIAGVKQVREIMRDFPDRCDAWISEGEHLPPPEEAPGALSWYQLSPRLFQDLDVNGTQSPLLLVTTPRIGKWDVNEGFAGGCTLLVPFQDPENVGAVIRSAVAFGVKSIVLLAESAHPYHPKAVRASGGAVLYANLYQGPSIADLPADLPIVALSGEGKDISEFVFPDAFGLLPGVEGTGLPKHLRGNSVAIPVSDCVESLNAATAAGIALYLWSRSVKR